jgi:ribosomal protein S18 acetylase RimI-like enzyme
MPTPDLTIRQLTHPTPSDIAQLADILIAVVDQGASVGYLPPLEPADAAAYWSSVLEPGVVLLVAERGQQIVGTAQLIGAMRPNGRHRAEVAKVLVHPRAQRQGIGRALLAAIDDAARADERSLLVLDTRAGDPSNQLYRSAGYVEVGQIPRYARAADGTLADTVIYYKELAM